MEDALGGQTPAGSFEHVWRRNASKTRAMLIVPCR